MPTDPAPRRSEDELLGLVHQKADAIRRRRAMTVLGASTLVVLLIAGTAALAGNGGGGPSRTIRAAGEPTETTSTGVTTTTALDGVVVPAPDAAPPTSTTARRATTTTTRAQCSIEEVVHGVKVVTDKASYRPGENVVVTTSLTNVSGRDCSEPDGSLIYVYRAPAAPGEPLTNDASHGPLTSGAWSGSPGRRWPAGATLSWSLCWPQRDLNGQVAPGSYYATVSWKPAGQGIFWATTYFDLQPGTASTTTSLTTTTTSTTVPGQVQTAPSFAPPQC